MNRYIDVDMLDEVVLDLNVNHNRGITRGDYKLIESVLFDFPTADVIEVVRCKDCIYHTEDDECANGRWDNWSNSEYGLYPEALDMDYCSYGVRKDG